MASTTTAPRVDVGALSSTIRNEAARRVATLLVTASAGLDDRENGLNELQKIELVECAIEQFDGFERSVSIALLDGLTHAGVGAWGFADELADLAPQEGSET